MLVEGSFDDEIGVVVDCTSWIVVVDGALVVVVLVAGIVPVMSCIPLIP